MQLVCCLYTCLNSENNDCYVKIFDLFQFITAVWQCLVGLSNTEQSWEHIVCDSSFRALRFQSFEHFWILTCTHLMCFKLKYTEHPSQMAWGAHLTYKCLCHFFQSTIFLNFLCAKITYIKSWHILFNGNGNFFFLANEYLMQREVALIK